MLVMKLVNLYKSIAIASDALYYVVIVVSYIMYLI